VSGPAGSDDIAEEATRLRLSVTRLARSMRQQSDTGLSPSQASALASIARHGPLTLGALADWERVAPPTITRIVAKLEDDGLVTRETSATDRRRAEVAITEGGLDVMRETNRRKNAWLADRLADLTPEQRERIHDAIDALDVLTSTAIPTEPRSDRPSMP
jgi:DNA-binding MarR family transcriptional regulator